MVGSATVTAGGLLIGYPRNAALWLLLTPAAYLVIISGGTRGIRRFRSQWRRFAVLGAAALTLGRRDPVAPPEPSGPNELPARLGRPKSLH